VVVMAMAMRMGSIQSRCVATASSCKVCSPSCECVRACVRV
jgi:hypothetical protein